MQKLLIYLTISMSFALGACAAHKIDIQQGSVITQEMLDQIKPGMTKRQVTFVLGTPSIADPFHEGRWDYVYSYRAENQPDTQARLTVYFDGDSLRDFKLSSYPVTAVVAPPATGN